MKYTKKDIGTSEEKGLTFTINGKRINGTIENKLIRMKYVNVDIDRELARELKLVMTFRGHSMRHVMETVIERYIYEGLEEIKNMLQRNKDKREQERESANNG